MASKSKITLRQVIVIIFLALIVIGFTAPLILYSIDDPFSNAPTLVEPRLCKSDADCFLTCETGPLQVICLQNYCMQNSCDEFNPYAYTTQPVDFTLSATLTGQPVTWAMTPGDSFVQVNGDTVSVFTTDLTVRDVAGKLGLYFVDGGCLKYNGKDYCAIDGANLSITINGNITQTEQYVPVFGDDVEIVYE